MNEETLFLRAMELPAAERSAFLDRECPDPVLRARIEALLAADAASHSPLDSPPHRTDDATLTHGNPAATGSFRPAASPEEAEGTVIEGRYKLRQQIGEGGMGTVWMADQTEPVKRKVAVKLIRVERGQSKTILARFEAERQAIALMDHPHIAKLLDAGTTDDGAPFFVMELVKGIPLNDYCDQHKLTIPERLNLFQQICSAVQHAHQKGIIHRDLKPGNILVESHDGKPVPKVIDFGLAKATTGLQLTEQSMFTAFGSVMGTPLYMAPEQATFNAIDVDTRADVYALGVVLYELLTGTTPLTKETMKKAALDEMLKLIREQEAPTPSSRLSSAESAPSVAANRQIEPAKLGRFVKGELDWIVMKALSKERDRRYETANGFGKDIERFLNHEPVTVGPPSASYRLRKFVRRNRPQVIAASLVLLALVAGVVGTTLGLVEAKRQEAEAVKQAALAREEAAAKELARDEEARQRAIAQEKELQANTAADKERTARLEEEQQRKFAEAIAAFVKDDFLALTSVEGQGRFGGEGLDRNATLLALLNRAADKLKARKDLHPRIEAELCWIVGVSYRGIGEAHKGLPYLERSVELRRTTLGAKHPATLDAMNSLAIAYAVAGRPDRSVPLLEEAVQSMTEVLGADHDNTLFVVTNLGLNYLAIGETNRALRLLEKTLPTCEAKLGTDHPHTLTCMNNLARVCRAVGESDRATTLHAETLKRRRTVLGNDHIDTLTSMNNLAIQYGSAGKLDLALPLLEEALRRRRAKFGDDHPATLTSMNSLAMGYRESGQFDKALPLLEETLQLRQAKLGPDHPDTIASMSNLAGGYRAAGKINLTMDRFAESAEMLRKSLSLSQKAEPDVWTTFNTESLLGGALLGQKKYADAEPLLLKGYEGMKAREKSIPPQGGTRIPEALDRLIELYTATNKPDEVEKYRELRAKYPTPKEVAPPPREKK